jgi:hypothetical protein
VEGNNAGTGITATVTSSPGGKGVGSGYNFFDYFGGNAFTVTSGNITVANALFVNSANSALSLYLGTPGNGNIDFSTRFMDAVDNSFDYQDNSNATTQFTAATSTPVPFESSPIALPASLAVCFGAAKLRRNHLAKKRMVSVEA